MDEAFVIRALSALAHPTRLRAYAHVASESEGVTPSQIAVALNVGKTLLTGHLASLVAAGLLDRTDHGRTATLRANRHVAAELLGRLGEVLVVRRS